MAIPRVNPNPRIDQHKVAAPAPKRALAKAAAVKTPATSTAQASNTVPETQSTPADPLASVAAPTAPAPTGMFDLPAYTPANGQPDPRDATYWANLAKLKFSDEQEYSKGLREQTRADTDYGDALQTAIRNRGVQQRELGENAIRGNLGASGWLDRNEGEQTTAYTQDRAHAARNKEEEDQSRLAAQSALRQSYGLELQGALSEYGERKAQQERERAQNEAPPLEEEAASSSGGGKASAPKIGIGKAKALNPVKEAIGKKRKAR